MCAAMPACVLTSPAVVMVRRPVRKVSFSRGIGTGLQRNWLIGRSCSAVEGAVFQYGSVVLRNLVPCCTDGRMRYSQERSLAPRGAVKGEPDSCSAYSP